MHLIRLVGRRFKPGTSETIAKKSSWPHPMAAQFQTGVVGIGYPSNMAWSFTPLLLNFTPTQLRSYTSVRRIHIPQMVHSISWTPLAGSSFLLSWPVEAPSKSVQNAFSQAPGGIRVMNALGMSLSIFWTSGWQHCLPQFQLSSLQEAPKSTWRVCWAFILIKTC